MVLVTGQTIIACHARLVTLGTVLFCDRAKDGFKGCWVDAMEGILEFLTIHAGLQGVTLIAVQGEVWTMRKPGQ
jgi:hypothetical protein